MQLLFSLEVDQFSHMPIALRKTKQYYLAARPAPPPVAHDNGLVMT